MDKTGGPAFPGQSPLELFPDGSIRDRRHYESYDSGMTLLDWFAGKAMPTAYMECRDADVGWPEIARMSYDFAEAMLAEKRRREAANG